MTLSSLLTIATGTIGTVAEIHSAREQASLSTTDDTFLSLYGLLALGAASLISYTRNATCKRYIADDTEQALIYRRALRIKNGKIVGELAFDYTEECVAILEKKPSNLVLSFLLSEKLRQRYGRAERRLRRSVYDYLEGTDYKGLENLLTTTPHSDVRKYANYSLDRGE